MMKYSLITVYVLFSMVSFSQEIDTLISGDFNKDGYIDSIKYTEENGNATYIQSISIKYGKKNTVLIEKEYDFSSFIDVVPIPKVLTTEKNEALKSKAQEILFKNYGNKMDESLNWLIEVFSNKKKLKQLKWDYQSSYTPEWKDNLLICPKGREMIQLNLLSYPKLYRALNVDTNRYKSAWLLYYGLNQCRDSIEEVEKGKDTSLLVTTNGVIVKIGSKYSWSFISDSKATSSLEKLRWKSIKKVEICGSSIIILQKDSPYIYFVDYVKGKIKRYNNAKVIDGIYIDGKKLHFKSKGIPKEETIDLKQLW